MIKITTTLLLSFLLPFAIGSFVCAQEQSPVDYMEQIDKAEQEANQKYLAYVSAAAHSGRIKKVERMRQQLLDGIINSRNNLRGIPLYKGEKELRQSSIDYLDLLYHVFNEDYVKIVNIEEIAEQSFNEMQAYLLLQEKTSEKLNDAQAKRNDASKKFAEKYNIRLLEEASAMSEKMNKAADVIKYRNGIYLLFFKCNWQWNEMNKTIQSSKVNDIEQARNAVMTYADEGLTSLGTLKGFDGDASLVNTCKQILNRYRLVADKEVPGIITFILASENFEKVKKSFDARPERERKKQDVDQYNKAVEEMNAGVNRFNAANKSLYETNKDLVNLWQKTDKDFSDGHTPYFRR
ncbi:hypothetical protein [Agriterribacter sp.]|uniref:LIC11966 family surface protein n=1 Tax=Agriterribacter sp. TaxID=2821509 RepID=UPI002C4A1348|nr:hypothetical protein [Agriterribacter sp.]HRO48114.1 hypothetical protein [Agriterribacter sp.]HRQ17962.1 hypothetical protein [Agriterribacter sp.]